MARSFSDDGNASASTSAHRRDLSAAVLEMAIVLRRQGQIDEAIRHFEDALRLRREIELTALNDPSPQARADAIIALGRNRDRQAVAPITRSLREDSSPQVRESACLMEISTVRRRRSCWASICRRSLWGIG